jgi:hypothetical protein
MIFGMNIIPQEAVYFVISCPVIHTTSMTVVLTLGMGRNKTNATVGPKILYSSISLKHFP